MTVRIVGELPTGNAEDAVYAVRFWAKDTRNHRFLRAQFDSRVHDVHKTLCSHGYVTRWAFRDELSQELGEDRDKSRDCPSCFRRRR